MSIVIWFAVGALAGSIAGLLTEQADEFGWPATVCVGTLGAFAAGALMSLLGGPGISGFNISSIAVAVGGAFVLLLVAEVWQGRST